MSANYWEIHSKAKRILGEFPLFTGENSIVGEQGALAIELAVEHALDFHSTVEPRVLLSNALTIPQNEARRYYVMDAEAEDSPVPQWDEGFSQPLGVIVVPDELPDDADPRDLTLWNEAPNNLTKFSNFELVEFEDKEYLEIKNHEDTIALTDKVLVRYSSRHKIMGDQPDNFAQVGLKPEYDNSDPPMLTAGDPRTATIKDARKTAITYLAVSGVMEMAAIRAEKALDPASGMEFVSMRTKSSGYRRIAEFYKERYDREVGIDGVAGASSSIPISPFSALNLTGVFAQRVGALQAGSQTNRSLNR